MEYRTIPYEQETANATRQLAAFLANATFRDLPFTTVRRASWIAADTFGVMMRGSVEPEAERLYIRVSEESSGQASTAVVFRPGLPKAETGNAAFLNAVAASFLELDEGSRPTGHPALHVLPTTLAFAQSRHASGQDFLTAFVLGYEIQARIQSACQLRVPVHPHGNFGHVGAVAAIGKLSGWDEDMLFNGLVNATALALATSWQPCIVGGTVRNAYAGLTARTAFTVRQLVECGYTGYDGALAETFGDILGTDFNPMALIQSLGSSYAVEQNYFKFHAACALTHPVLDAVVDALQLRRIEGEYPPFETAKRFHAEEIARVRVWVLERSLRLNVSARDNQLSAKFSIPYAVAAFLVAGQTSMDTFRSEWFSHPDVQDLQSRVEIIGDPQYATEWPKKHPARVEIVLRDGQILSGQCDNPFGSITQEPTETDLRAKFSALTTGLLTKEQRDGLWDVTMALAEHPDVNSFPN